MILPPIIKLGLRLLHGILHTCVMYALMYSAVQRLPTDLQGALSFGYPVVAILIDVVALGTQLQPVQIGGITSVILAAAGVTLGIGAQQAGPRVSDWRTTA